MSEYLKIQINGQIILPASICAAANLQEGDLLEVIVEGDRSIQLIPQSAETRKMVEQGQLEDINWVLKHKQRP
ncbi:MAG: AbrB/MazE/SpoVT family DNA-binding domain-containing protein [Chloroflexota bacterium]